MDSNQVEVFVMCENMSGALSQLKIRDNTKCGKQYAVVARGEFRSVFCPKTQR